VTLMLLLAGLSAPLTPALLGVLLPWVAPATNLHVSYPGIVRILLVTQLLPLALGLGFRRAAPRWAGRAGKPLGLLANALLLALVGAIVATQSAMLAALRPRAWLGMGLLLSASLGLGWACGGPGLARRKALATTTATRNVGVGLVVAARDFAGTPAIAAVVAYGLVSILGALACAMLLGRRGAIEAEGAPDAPSR
jgi:BASS family bile acid:Na+ symporter